MPTSGPEPDLADKRWPDAAPTSFATDERWPDAALARFADPPARYGPLPIWWWSGDRVTRERLRWQMAQMVAGGIRQAVVMCLAPTGPLFGCLADDPPFQSGQWWRLLDDACADAAELGFTLWLYDQIGFSGANIQGRLVAANPEYAGMLLRRTVGTGTVACPPGDTALAGYALPDGGGRVDLPVVAGRVTWSGGPAQVVLVHAGTSGFDYLSVAAGAALLDAVHGEYARRVGAWFGRAIAGFFQDELPGLPTWSADFAGTFSYDPLPWLWALWDDDGSPEAAAFRRDFHAHRAARAREAFFDPHADWLDRHGLVCGFDQPTPAREGDPVGGVRLYGDYLGTHARFGAPGSDHWGDAKVHSSLAHARGHARTWIEAFHSSGWGGTLEETYDWLAPFLRRGATLYNPHAVYYSTVGGWWEWAAPSTCWRQPYWPAYEVFATAVARLCAVLSTGTHVCDTVLLSPTSTAQGYLTLAGPLPPARAAAGWYHELNGVNAWPAERPGVLERGGIDHDVLDEAAVAAGRVVDGTLIVGAEAYRNVVLPGAVALPPDTAARLRELACSGGRVVCVGSRPPDLTDVALLVGSAAEVPALLRSGPVRVTADAPYLLRRLPGSPSGDAYLVLLIAHDGATGTAQPILDWPDAGWADAGFPWDWYWTALRERGYRFTPVGDRSARLTAHGLAGYQAQRWDPRTGRRYAVTATDGSYEVPFDGPITVLVLAPELPEPDAVAPGPATGAIELPGPWYGLAESTLDNRWGDLAGPSYRGTLPIHVWRLSAVSSGGCSPTPKTGSGCAPAEDGVPVVATYGPFAEVRGPGDTPWRPAVWSLSRGIHKDPVHLDTLGPKGYVPEEFLDWRTVPAGEWVAVRTHLDLPDGYLAVGANAHREVYVDGLAVPVDGDGYLTFTAVSRGRSLVEIRLRSDVDGPVRASIAAVTDPDRYGRPEWLRGRLVQTDLPTGLDARACAAIQVASDGPCEILVNGVEVGRQGDFQPYPGHREVRVHPYHIGPFLKPGRNELALRLGDGTAALVDSGPDEPRVVSGPGWRGAQVDRRQPRDPRFPCAWARPHPLPGAGWLDPAADPAGTVVPVIPDMAPGPPREETLRFAAPLGTTALTVHTGLCCVVVAGGREHVPDAAGRVGFDQPLPPGAPVLLRFRAVDGRRGGALLDGPIEVTTAEAQTPLADWAALGLGNLGGQVRYRTTLRLAHGVPPGRARLDLGGLRGAADVRVNGTLADRLVWSPWRADVTGLLVAGDNLVEVVVYGTLAGYLDDASPTPAVPAGQTRTGLFGPVRLTFH